MTLRALLLALIVATFGAAGDGTAEPGAASGLDDAGPTLLFGGMTLQERDGRIVVEDVQSGSPADRAGVLPLDVVLVVGDVNLVDLQPLGLDAVRRVLRTAEGEEVRIVLGRGAGTFGIRIAAAAAGASRPVTPAPRRAPVQAGEPAPVFSGTDLRGKEMSLAALQGSPVLIDFWASWCPPCRANALVLRRIAAAHPDRLRVVGVGLDDDRKAWEAFVYNHHLPGLQIRDGRTGPVASAYGIAATGIPFAVLVDTTGRIVAAGPSITELEEAINRLVGGPAEGRERPR